MSESEQNEQYTSVVEALNKYKGKEASGSGGLIGSLVAVAVFIIFVAIFAFQAWQAGKARAKFLHEKVVREEEAKKAEVDAHLAENEEASKVLLDQYSDVLDKVDLLQEKIDASNRTYEAAMINIGRLSSWSQIDEFLKNPS